MNVAFFGGSFDPPHVAHVLGAAYLAGAAGFDLVLVVPTCEHAFGKPLSDFDQRVELCRLAFRELLRVQVSDLEGRLPRPTHTLSTLEAIASEHPSWRLRLVVGSDVLAETARWHEYSRVIELAPPFVLGRQGYPQPGAPLPVLPDVSSTQIRAMLSSSEPGHRPAELTRMLPPQVLQAIDRCLLYRCA